MEALLVLWTIGVYCWSGLFVADVAREFTNISTSNYLEDTKLFEKDFRLTKTFMHFKNYYSYPPFELINIISKRDDVNKNFKFR